MRRLRFAPRLRRPLVAVAIVLACGGRSFAAEAAAHAARRTETFDGIECQFSPEREDLARQLAHRFVLYNEAIAETRRTATASEKNSTVLPLSPAEMRANRATYLKHIASLLALEKPTALQTECYDTFLDNYEQTMRTVAWAYSAADGIRTIKRITIWDRSELVERLQRGETIAGFSYDPKTQQGSVTYGAEIKGHDEHLVDLEKKRKKLHRDYSLNFDTKDGVTTYRAQVTPKAAAKSSPDGGVDVGAPAPDKEKPENKTDWFPVVIPGDAAQLPTDALLAKLWDPADEHSVMKMMVALGKIGQSVPTVDPIIAFLVLHETIEVGITDRYFRSPDRRWFCDGVANYGAWRVLRDLHGEPAATRAHDLKASLAGYADMREQADLRKWAATENQSAEEQHSRLNSARYVFAEQAVVLMNAHAGDDVLPRLFKEIGKTPPAKVSMETVNQAWTKVAGTTLDVILAEAVQSPVPAPPDSARSAPPAAAH